MPKLFASEYERLEQLACAEGLLQGHLVPQQSESQVIIKYSSLDGSIERQVNLERLKSSIQFSDISEDVIQLVKSVAEDVPFQSLIMKRNRKVTPNPFQEEEVGVEAVASVVDTNLCIAEGSTLEVLKPEVRIEFAKSGQPSIKMDIKPTYNVKAVKGLLTKVHPKEADGKWLVRSGGELLPDKQNLAELDFIHFPFVAEFIPKETN